MRARRKTVKVYKKERLPQATHIGELAIVEGRPILCAVLENRTRVLTQEGFLTTIGRAAKAKGGTGSKNYGVELKVDEMPPFLAANNLKPFINNKLRESTTPIVFHLPTGRRAFGYDAKLLPMVCEVYLDARDEGQLLHTQEHIAATADLVMRALAHVGIIALVDEATGYQYDRERKELEIILRQYISEELLPWVNRFPDEFFKQVYRLQDWEYTGSRRRPGYVGKLINKYIYEQLPAGVLDELRQKNPPALDGRRQHKHHQFLTGSTGVHSLDKQLVRIVALMRVARDKQEFEEFFKRAGLRQPEDEELKKKGK